MRDDAEGPSIRLIESADESGGPDNITCVSARWIQ